MRSSRLGAIVLHAARLLQVDTRVLLQPGNSGRGRRIRAWAAPSSIRKGLKVIDLGGTSTLLPRLI